MHRHSTAAGRLASQGGGGFGSQGRVEWICRRHDGLGLGFTTEMPEAYCEAEVIGLQAILDSSMGR